MPNLFKLDQSDLRKLRKFQKRYPAIFQRAAASVLSSQAFHLKKEIANSLDETMTIRNPRFMNRHIAVIKANGSAPIISQFSVSGTTTGPRFSGWIEQETGQASDKDRGQTLAARGGNKAKQVKGKFRLKPGVQVKTAKDYKGKTVSQQTMAMIKAAQSGENKGMFYIPQGGAMNFKHGMYAFVGGRIQRVQNLDKPKNPKTTHFMQKALHKFDRSFNLSLTWKKELDFRLKRMR